MASTPSSVWGFPRSFRHLDLAAAPLLVLKTVPLDVAGLTAVVTNNFVTTTSTATVAGAGRAISTTAAAAVTTDVVQIHRCVGATPRIAPAVVATLALVLCAAAPVRRRAGHTVGKHDGRVTPLRDKYSIFEGVGARQEDLGSYLVFETL